MFGRAETPAIIPMATLRKRFSRSKIPGKKRQYLQYLWIVDFRNDGRRHIVSAGTSDLKTAEMIKNKIEIEVAQGRWGLKEKELPRVALREFAEDYVQIRKATKPARTAETDERALREFEKFTGKIELSEVTEELIEQFKAKEREKLKPVTVNIFLRHLKAAFSCAVRWGKLAQNPFKEIKPIETFWP